MFATVLRRFFKRPPNRIAENTPMPWISNDPEESAYLRDFEKLPERTVGLVGVVLVERRLKMSIKRKLRDCPDRKLLKDLFRTEGGPLASFGVQIDIGYAIGLYDWIARTDLNTCARIRNAFAHKLTARDFSSQVIADLCGNLRRPPQRPRLRRKCFPLDMMNSCRSTLDLRTLMMRWCGFGLL